MSENIHLAKYVQEIDSENKRNYVVYTLNNLVSENEISKDEMNNFYESIYNFVEKRCEKLNHDEKFEITTLESILYVISIYMKKSEDYIDEIKNGNVVEMYLKGKRLIDRKINIDQVLFHKVLSNKLKINHQIYNNIINYEFKNFFKKYNPEVNAKDIKIELNYPLHSNVESKYEGIELVEKYLQSMYYENAFCELFNIERVKSIANFSEMFNLNFFEIILTVALGCVIAGEGLKDLKVTQTELNKIYEIMDTVENKEDINVLISDACNKLRILLFAENEGLYNYIKLNFEGIQNQIYQSYKIRKLENIFMI